MSTCKVNGWVDGWVRTWDGSLMRSEAKTDAGSGQKGKGGGAILPRLSSRNLPRTGAPPPPPTHPALVTPLLRCPFCRVPLLQQVQNQALLQDLQHQALLQDLQNPLLITAHPHLHAYSTKITSESRGRCTLWHTAWGRRQWGTGAGGGGKVGGGRQAHVKHVGLEVWCHVRGGRVVGNNQQQSLGAGARCGTLHVWYDILRRGQEGGGGTFTLFWSLGTCTGCGVM